MRISAMANSVAAIFFTLFSVVPNSLNLSLWYIFEVKRGKLIAIRLSIIPRIPTNSITCPKSIY